MPPYTLRLISTRISAFTIAKNAVALIIRENFEKYLLCFTIRPAAIATAISAIRKYQSVGEKTDDIRQPIMAVMLPTTGPSRYEARMVPHRLRYAGSSNEKAINLPTTFSAEATAIVRMRLFHLFILKDSSHP